ncbi:coagulation factor IX [Spea bombifrons]|uniref:coagulation factor IX n=1 Tax=Spea bombifrons TaxID=233779 RepID=UPI00234B39CF|nr:coagulation factor IX [Spea bombifrons]
MTCLLHSPNMPFTTRSRKRMSTLLNILTIWLLGYFCSAEKTVFLSGKSASSVLLRQKRYNTGRLEEFIAGNLERECLEERCDYEEAREVFENDVKTNEFWKQYVDGDQCLSNPCRNGGVCKDDVSTYVCWCAHGYAGKNCELALPVTCSISNGGCQQMCKDHPVKKVICSCASGYRLAEDGKTCEDAVPFPCGKVSAPEALPKHVTRSLLDPEQFNATESNTQNVTESLGNSEDIVPVTEDPDVRIVGGTDSLRGEFPWQVQLVNKEKVGFCGGSIVNEKWIVTAAHCFITVGEFTVTAGEHNTEVNDGTEQYREVAKIIVHPTYNASRSKFNNDIALLELEKPLELNDYVRPICIGNKDFTESLMKSQQFSIVTGWGDVRYRGRPAIILQKLAVPYINRAACKSSSRSTVSINMFCAGYPDQSRDACEGDSGGPHATEYKTFWFLTGITSWGEKCAEKDRYGVYTRLSRYTDWIRAITKL